MNLPNKLTMFRVILIPFFVFFLLTDLLGDVKYYIALGIFAVASLTDLFDGKIARKYNLITDFGKFMDPIADKLLVCSAFIAFVQLQIMPAWSVIVLIAREFIISGFRLVASDAGVVLAASWWGKSKTAVQMVACIFFIVYLPLMNLLPASVLQALEIAKWVLIVLSVVLSLVSLVDYLVKNRHVIRNW